MTCNAYANLANTTFHCTRPVGHPGPHGCGVGDLMLTWTDPQPAPYQPFTSENNLPIAWHEGTRP